MQQRHKKDKTVKVCPYVPRRVRDSAERLAKREMAKTKKPVFSTRFIADWTTAAHDIFAAQTDEEALVIFNMLRGKPVLKAPASATPCGDPNCFTSKPCKCASNTPALPVADGAQ